MLDARLRHQHPIERVAMAPRKREQSFAMVSPDRQQIEPIGNIEQSVVGGDAAQRH